MTNDEMLADEDGYPLQCTTPLVVSEPAKAEPVAWRYWESKYNEWEYSRYPVDGRTCEPLYTREPEGGT